MSRPLSVADRPDSQSEIARIADRLLRSAGVLGTTPTPIDELVRTAKIHDIQDLDAAREHFLSRLSADGQSLFKSMWQKIRGIADLRDRVVYVPTTTTSPRVRFAKAHELGHQVVPWHRVNPAYADDDRSLSPEAQHLFDREANLFAAEVVFQSRGFTVRARDFAPSLDAIFTLADQYGASRHCTIRRFVEEYDEPIAVVPYWPSQYAVDEQGNPVLRRGQLVASSAFLHKCSDIQLPDLLRTGDPWVAARDLERSCDGEITLGFSSGQVSLHWQSWWNSYCLLVLLRRKPKFHLVGRLLHRA